MRPLSLSTLFPWVFSFRLLNALLCQTFFQPDEFYQSAEVAHRAVFGYGYLSWEWLPEARIRSPLHPMLLIPVYWILKVSGLDQTQAVVHAPKIVPALLATCIDISTYRFARKIAALLILVFAWQLLCSLISFFNAFVSVRNFSNSLETAVTALALSLWPCHGFMTSSILASQAVVKEALLCPLLLAALAVVVRPTSAVLWAHLGARMLRKCSWFQFDEVVILVFLISVGTLISTLVVDSIYYQQFTLTPFNFFTHNFSNSISLFYGSMPWHYYLSQGLPLLLFTQLPFTIKGAFYTPHKTIGTRIIAHNLASAVTTVLLFFSLLSHKEVRFAQPLLPILHVFTAMGLLQEDDSHPTSKQKLAPGKYYAPPSIRPKQPVSVRRRPENNLGVSKLWIGVLAATSLAPALYLNRLHSNAQVGVLEYLRGIPSAELRSVGFLMPCHSTPWQSHLHRSDLEELQFGGSGKAGRLWFITCEPPISGQNAKTYKDQSDFFYDDPLTYLVDRFPSSVNESFPPSPLPLHPPSKNAPLDLGWSHEWPSHLVLFDALLTHPGIRDLLPHRGYQEVWRQWNSHVQDDARRAGDVIVLQYYGH